MSIVGSNLLICASDTPNSKALIHENQDVTECDFPRLSVLFSLLT